MDEKRKKLNETLKGFNKKHKAKIFTMGNEIEELEVIPTGVKKVDDFLGGGFKKGAHTIIWGLFSVGKTALILTTIANAQKEGKLVCYVNTEKPIEPERFEFFGINLDEMVYVEAPENAEQALEAMRTLCKEKVIDLFIIDSTNGLCPKSVQEDKGGKERSLEKKNVAALALTLSNFYNTVNAYVFKSRAAVVWIGQARTQGIGTFFTRMGLSGGNAQEFYAYQIVMMRKGQNANAPIQKIKEYFIDPDNKIRFTTIKEPIGFDAVLKLTKTNSCKSVKENTELNIPFVYEKGFVDSIEETDEVPIRIDPEMTEEQKLTISQYLMEKNIVSLSSDKGGLKTPNEEIKHSVPEQQESVTELKPDTKEEGSNTVKPTRKVRAKSKSSVTREEAKDAAQQKKRGRPKKEK